MDRIKRYKLVIWDVDGTLLDTSLGIISSTRYMIQRMGYEMPEDEIIEAFVGPRIQDSLSTIYGLSGDELKEASKIFRDNYKENVLQAAPYEGIYDILGHLKKIGVLQAVATNKRQDFVDSLLDKFNMSMYMESVHGTDLAGELKKSDLIKMCLRDCCVERDEAVMIGDSDYDADAANEVGIDFIGVTYGFGFKSEEEIIEKNGILELKLGAV